MSGIWKRKKRSDIQTPTTRKGRKQLWLNLTPPRQISTLPDVLQTVVHPPHVPLKPKAQTSRVGRLGNPGPRCRFLGDGGDAGEAFVAHFVAALHEGDGIQILASAKHIWHPLTRLARVVEVQHGRDSIHAQSVNMVFVEPKQGISNEEVFHLIAAIIKDERAPVHVLAKTRVFMFVETGAVIARKTVGILGKMTRHPV